MKKTVIPSGAPARFVHENSSFLGISYNLGPRAEARLHRDDKNLAPGICVIAALGKFDHRLSGHLILVEPKTILEVKPGDVVIMPSAVITHCNSPLRPGDFRASIVQYTAGAIFRFIAQGFKTQKNMSQEAVQELKDGGTFRFQQTWNLFPSEEDINYAKEHGRYPDRNIANEIETGQSFLLPCELFNHCI